VYICIIIEQECYLIVYETFFPIDPLQPTDTSVPELISQVEKVLLIYLMWTAC